MSYPFTSLKINRNEKLNWFITFPQCTLTPDEFLRELPATQYYYCKQEYHQDSNHHLHACFKLKKGLSFSKLKKWLGKKFPTRIDNIKIETLIHLPSAKHYLEPIDHTQCDCHCDEDKTKNILLPLTEEGTEPKARGQAKKLRTVEQIRKEYIKNGSFYIPLDISYILDD